MKDKFFLIVILIIIIIIIAYFLLNRQKKVKESFSYASSLINNVLSGTTGQNVQSDISGLSQGIAELATNPVGGAIQLAKTGLQIFDQVQGVSSESDSGEQCNQSGCSTCIFGETKKCVIDSCNPDKTTCYTNWDNALNDQIENVIKSGIQQIYSLNFSASIDFETRKNSLLSILSNIQKTNKQLVNIDNGLLTTQRFMVNNSTNKANLFNQLIQMETSSILVNNFLNLLEIINKYYNSTPSNSAIQNILKQTVTLKVYLATQAYNIGNSKTQITFTPNTPIISYSNSLVNQGLALVLIGDLYNQSNISSYPSIVRQSLLVFQTLFTTGSMPVGLPQSTSSVYTKLKDNLASIMGNEYLNSNVTSDSNSDISDESIPYNIAESASKHFFYNTLDSCSTTFNNAHLSLPSNIQKQLDELQNLKNLMTTSQLTTHDTQQMRQGIEETRKFFFIDNNGKWRPQEDSNNYNPCSPININYNTVDLSSSLNQMKSQFFSFQDVSKEIELQRKKILNIKENIFKNLYGSDVVFNYDDNYPTPNCPKIFNQDNTDVLQWTRDNNQPSVCISSPLSNEKKGVNLQGNMKPGQIENGIDIWLNNISNLQTNLDNLASVSQTSSLYKYSNIDSTSTDLWRAGGNMIQNILQDRDWVVSTQKWNEKKQDMNTANEKYFRENIINIYNLNNPNKTSFSLIYDTDNSTYKKTFLRAFIPDKIIKNVYNLTFNNNDSKRNGIARIYTNMYQHQDLITFNFKDHPNIINKTLDIFSIVFHNIFWNLNEIVSDQRDVYIICKTNLVFNQSNSQINNFYSPNQKLLGIHKSSDTSKIYYATKNSSLLFHSWKIIKHHDSKYYYIYNIETKQYLAWGTSCHSFKNINQGFQLYLIPEDDLKSSCQNLSADQNQSYCYQLQNEASWNLVDIGPNTYNIYSSNGSQLWFSGNTFKVYPNSNSQQTPSIIKPLAQDLGWVGVTSNTSTGNNNVPEWCITGEDSSECYNSMFIIIPKEPIDITNSSILKIDSIDQSLYNDCTSSGTKLDADNTWFREISPEFTTSYADRDSKGNIVESQNINNPNRNSIKDIYKNYNSQNQIITSLKGGDGYNCSQINYCTVESQPKNAEGLNININNLDEENIEYDINQSNNLDLQFYNKDKKLAYWKTVKAPLKRFNYTCKKTDFIVYQIGNNNFKLNYASPINELIKLPNDTENSNSEDINLILLIYSFNKNITIGKDFGLSPHNNYIWWKNDTDLNSLRYIYGNKHDILENFNTIQNNLSTDIDKKTKNTICHYHDIWKFYMAGLFKYQNFTPGHIYAYSNVFSHIQTEEEN